MLLDAAALKTALQQTAPASSDGLEHLHTLLCRREARIPRAAKATGDSGEELLVACTQERRLFLELNAQTEGASLEVRPIRFVHSRDRWLVARRQERHAEDRRADRGGARAGTAGGGKRQLPLRRALPDHRRGRRGRSGGGHADRQARRQRADRWAGGGVAQSHAWAVHSGRLTRLSRLARCLQGRVESRNPIDLDLCTRCNACIEVCPEGAIDFTYQIDLAACKSHRDCVRACGAAGAIDFDRAPRAEAETFDLVLDLRAQPAFTMHQPPQGYFHTGGDAQALHKAVLRVARRGGRVREAQVLRLPAEDLRAQPQRAHRLHRLHRRLLCACDFE